MTSTNFVVDDPSPLLHFQTSGQWADGDPSDLAAPRYFGNSTFTATNTTGASMTFVFNGTSIIVGGAKRLNHGPYQVSLDVIVTSYNGFDKAGQFQIALFQQDNMKQGLHNITITNLGTGNQPFVDIDFVKWSSTVQGSKAKPFEDTDAIFAYSPSGAWSTDVSKYPGFSNGNGHISTSNNALCTITFEGDAIDLSGSVGPDHGLFQVSVDGGISTTYNATRSRFLPQQTLFHADNLGAGRHVVKVTQQPGSAGQSVLAIDKALVTEYTGASSHGLSSGAKAGIALGVLIPLALVAFGLFYWIRRRRRHAHAINVPPVYTGPGPMNQVLPFQAAHFTMPSDDKRGLHKADYSMSSTVSRPTFGGPYDSYMSGQSSQYNSTEDPEHASFQYPTKYPVVMLPPSAHQRLDHVPAEELRQQRMVVPGREQDGGPARFTMLPPDYIQATEPYRPV